MSELMTLEEARGFLAAAVETQGPEFVYNREGRYTCYYVPVELYGADAPQARTGCLIGVALGLAGRTAEELRSWNATVNECEVEFRLTFEAAQYLADAQAVQDNGGSWGSALTTAEAGLLSAS